MRLSHFLFFAATLPSLVACDGGEPKNTDTKEQTAFQAEPNTEQESGEQAEPKNEQESGSDDAQDISNQPSVEALPKTEEGGPSDDETAAIATIQELENANSKLIAENAHLADQIARLVDQNASSAKEAATKQLDLEETKNNLEAKEKEIEQKLATIADLKAQMDALRDQLTELQNAEATDFSSIEAKVVRIENDFISLIDGLPKDLESYTMFVAKFLGERQAELEAAINNGAELTHMLETLEKMALKLSILEKISPEQVSDATLALKKQIALLHARISTKGDEASYSLEEQLSWGAWAASYGSWALGSIWDRTPADDVSDETAVEFSSPKVVALQNRLGLLEENFSELQSNLTTAQPEDRQHVEQLIAQAVLEIRLVEAQLVAQEQFDRAEALKAHHAKNLNEVHERLQSEIDQLTAQHGEAVKNFSKANHLLVKVEQENQKKQSQLLAELKKQKERAQEKIDDLEAKIAQSIADLAQASGTIADLTADNSVAKQDVIRLADQLDRAQQQLAGSEHAIEELTLELEPYRKLEAKRQAMIKMVKNLPAETLADLKDLFAREGNGSDFSNGLDDHNFVTFEF